jgi:hypothetical protein
MLNWPAKSDAIRYGLWINRINDEGQTTQARIEHVAARFDISGLQAGRYSAWVRSITVDGETVARSYRTPRLNIVVPRVLLSAVVFDVELLQALDSIWCVLRTHAEHAGRISFSHWTATQIVARRSPR